MTRLNAATHHETFTATMMYMMTLLTMSAEVEMFENICDA